MANEQEQVEIYVEEDMDVAQRAQLVAKLENQRGIIRAWFAGGDHHRLTVFYERDSFSHVTLLDAIRKHGFRAKIGDT